MLVGKLCILKTLLHFHKAGIGTCKVLWTVLLQVGCLILLDGGPGYFHSQFNQGIQAASKEEVRFYHKRVHIS